MLFEKLPHTLVLFRTRYHEVASLACYLVPQTQTQHINHTPTLLMDSSYRKPLFPVWGGNAIKFRVDL